MKVVCSKIDGGEVKDEFVSFTIQGEDDKMAKRNPCRTDDVAL